MHLSIIPLLCAFDVYRQKAFAVDWDKEKKGGSSFLTIAAWFKGLSSLGRVVVVWKCFVCVWQTMCLIFKNIFFPLSQEQIGNVYGVALADQPDSGGFFFLCLLVLCLCVVLNNFWKHWLQSGALSNINRQLAETQKSAIQAPATVTFFLFLYKAAANVC